MFECHSCRHQELAGALFCSECGAQLDLVKEETQAGVHAAGGAGQPPIPISRSKLSPDSDISLRIVDTDVIFPLLSQAEITLGRISEGQPIIPDIDLGPYQAYEAGVSRLHASIQINNHEIGIVDLGSANGTRVNGKKIEPNHPCSVRHGDVCTLGRLKVQIIIHQ